ncbi:MAG: ATP-binding protein, partial [Sulfolobales archaeon]
AVVVDDVFQYLEPRWAAVFVKGMLELIEHPVERYEKIVAIVATSEGVSRYEVGRHKWAEIRFMWNMSRNGFKELYDRLPSNKPDFEDIWRLCGGNPSILSQLYQYDWSVDYVVKNVIESKRLYTFITSLNTDEKGWLLEAITDPDTLMQRERIQLLNKLVELNLVVDDIVFRDEFLWIDEPPPEKDLELGVGKYIAWQTPIHREAVRKVLKVFK